MKHERPIQQRPRGAGRLALSALICLSLLTLPLSPRAETVNVRPPSGLHTEITLHGVSETRRAPLERLTRHALQDVERVLQARMEGNLRVEIVGSDRDFAEVLRAHGTQAQAEPWIAGLAMLHDDRIIIRLNGPGLLRTSEVMRHEIAHIAMHALAGQRPLPRWYHEGVAMIVAGEATYERLRDAIGASAFHQLESLQGLEEGFYGNQISAKTAYATSAGFLRFAIQRTGHRGALADLHRRMSWGLDFGPAFIATFGLKPEDLFKLYAQYVGAAGSRWSLALSDNIVWSILSTLAFVILGLTWWRQRRLSSEAIDLKGIAEIGEEAMRTGILWSDPLDIEEEEEATCPPEPPSERPKTSVDSPISGCL